MTPAPNPLVRGRSAPAFPPFRARWPWRGGDLQTIRNNIWYRRPDFSPFRAERLTLAMRDGSALLALLNTPPAPTQYPLVVLVHGLTGSEDSLNIMASAAYHLQRGFPTLRLNLRGAGPSRSRSVGCYHAGRSADLRDAVASLPDSLKARGIFLVGVSLGGNVCLKLLAENDGISSILAAASVCAPIDLKVAQMRIGSRRNAFYERHLLQSMRVDALATAGDRQAEVAEILRNVRTVYDFDDKIVAPANGFAGAEDYYRRSSAGPLLGAITTPTLLVHARTDPWVPAEMYLSLPWSGACTLLLAPDGGHVGFHGADSPVPWHDRCINQFFENILRGR